MRKFSVGTDKDGIKRLFLNNKPYFHNGLLDQGYYPDGLLTPPSNEAMKYDIEYVKSAGFNMLRKHIKVEPFLWYHYCDVNGIIVQLPLPPQFDALQILSMISYHKDVDGFSPYNAGLLQMNNSEAVVAATPGGVYELLKDIPGGLSGKHALIIGRSNIVGRPLADLLLNHDCTVTVAHSKTVNLLLLCREADIVIAACGCPRLVKGDWIKPGAAVIDVGINRVDGKLVGDVDFDDVKEKAGFISPVPGGVGPMTVAMLLQNT